MFKELTDEQILQKYKQGSELALDFLLNKYKSYASKIARSYFLVGGESEDLLQEAMLGLYRACRNYNPNCGSGFKTFALLCITRSVQSAVKIANRKKYKMLNESYSLSSQGKVEIDELSASGEEICLYVPSDLPDPEDALLAQEKEQEFEKMLDDNLSNKENQVLALYLKGLSYVEIAKALNENTKTIDNAIARTKRKLIEVFGKK